MNRSPFQYLNFIIFREHYPISLNNVQSQLCNYSTAILVRVRSTDYQSQRLAIVLSKLKKWRSRRETFPDSLFSTGTGLCSLRYRRKCRCKAARLLKRTEIRIMPVIIFMLRNKGKQGVRCLFRFSSGREN